MRTQYLQAHYPTAATEPSGAGYTMSGIWIWSKAITKREHVAIIHYLPFWISNKAMHQSTDRLLYASAFVMPVVEHWDHQVRSIQHNFAS